MRVREIRSGGQTGVDRAALDAAIALGIPRAGWVPKGRRAEDGVIPERYSGLRETPTADYADRTERNVRDADATLILSAGPPAGGTAYTLEVAKRLGRPVLVIDLIPSGPLPADRVRSWLASFSRPPMLNVAGPRESQAPGIHTLALDLLLAALE